MKKFLLSFILVSLSAMVVLKSFQDTKSNTKESTVSQALGVTTSENEIQKYTIVYDNRTYETSIVKIPLEKNISLFSNLENPQPAYELVKEYNCTTLSSAGFYTPQQKPVGHLISEFETIEEYRESALFDGLLTINDFDTVRISREMPKDRLRASLQTGPMLIENNKTQILQIRNDYFARRIVAATTGLNELVLLSIYEPSSKFQGPKLQDLPEILSLVEEISNIDLADAINMDGGTASALYSGNFVLSEASNIGSFWCIN